MRVTCGIFRWQADAERASRRLYSVVGLRKEQIILLVPGEAGKQAQRVPVCTAEAPGVGKALGIVLGAALGMSAGFGLGAAISEASGAGSTTALLFWGVTILGFLGAAGGAAIGSALDHAMTNGLPADEWFVYESAIRMGRSVVLAFPQDRGTLASARALMTAEGAECIDEARKLWWIGLRSAEHELYSAPVQAAPRTEARMKLSD